MWENPTVHIGIGCRAFYTVWLKALNRTIANTGMVLTIVRHYDTCISHKIYELSIIITITQETYVTCP